jgi:hypothetical protein
MNKYQGENVERRIAVGLFRRRLFGHFVDPRRSVARNHLRLGKNFFEISTFSNKKGRNIDNICADNRNVDHGRFDFVNGTSENDRKLEERKDRPGANVIKLFTAVSYDFL